MMVECYDYITWSEANIHNSIEKTNQDDEEVSVFLHLVCSELRQYKNVRALLLFQYKSTHFSVATKKKSVTLSETSSTYSISL